MKLIVQKKKRDFSDLKYFTINVISSCIFWQLLNSREQHEYPYQVWKDTNGEENGLCLHLHVGISPEKREGRKHKNTLRLNAWGRYIVQPLKSPIAPFPSLIQCFIPLLSFVFLDAFQF